MDNAICYTYFGARYYDSDLSVWLSVDPLSDKYPNMSPYMYTAGNPIRLIDPNGESIYIFFLNESSSKSNATSTILGFIQTKFDYDGRGYNKAFALDFDWSTNKVIFKDKDAAGEAYEKLSNKVNRLQKKGKDVSRYMAALEYYELIAEDHDDVKIYNESNPDYGSDPEATNILVQDFLIEESNNSGSRVPGVKGDMGRKVISEIDESIDIPLSKGNGYENNTPKDGGINDRQRQKLEKNHNKTDPGQKPRYDLNH